MRVVRLASETDFEGWRTSARALRLAGTAPEDVAWRVGGTAGLLDEEPVPSPPAGLSLSVPRDFLALARQVVLNRAEDRFDLLYRLLWRLQERPVLLRIVTDED